MSTTAGGTMIVMDADGGLYECTAEQLAPHKVSAERMAELGAAARTEDVSGYHQSGYVVRPGDSLWAISYRLYGDGRMWPLLYAANADLIRNPNLIYAGQTIRLV